MATIYQTAKYLLSQLTRCTTEAEKACLDIYLSEHVSEMRFSPEPIKKAWSIGEEVYGTKSCNADLTEAEKLDVIISVLDHHRKPVNGKYRWQSHELPPWIPQDAWTDWMQIRIKLKAVNSERALNSLIAKLDLCQKAGYGVEAVINEAVERSWKSVDPDWLKLPKKVSRGTQQQYDAYGNPI